MRGNEMDFKVASDYLDIGNHSGVSFDARFWTDEFLPPVKKWMKYSHVLKGYVAYNNEHDVYVATFNLKGGGSVIMNLKQDGNDIKGEVHVVGDSKSDKSMKSFDMITVYMKELVKRCN